MSDNSPHGQFAPIRHMVAYHCHARGITNIDGLASSLFIRVYRTLILSVNVCNFQVPMWTLQSAETEIYSVHGSFVVAESPTHREYWPLSQCIERVSGITQHEDFNSTPTGRYCFKLFHYRGRNRRRSEVSENKWVQFHGEISLAMLS